MPLDLYAKINRRRTLRLGRAGSSRISFWWGKANIVCFISHRDKINKIRDTLSFESPKTFSSIILFECNFLSHFFSNLRWKKKTQNRQWGKSTPILKKLISIYQPIVSRWQLQVDKFKLCIYLYKFYSEQKKIETLETTRKRYGEFTDYHLL